VPFHTALLALKKLSALPASKKPFWPPVRFWTISGGTDGAIAQRAILGCTRIPQAVVPQSLIKEHLLDLGKL
jgi:hypothetical protein